MIILSSTMVNADSMPACFQVALNTIGIGLFESNIGIEPKIRKKKN